MKKITTQEESDQLVEAINIILAYDYFRIILKYPGIEPRELSHSNVLFAAIDIDSLCSIIKGVSKEDWIHIDTHRLVEQKVSCHSKGEEDIYGTDRHSGERFYREFKSEIGLDD